MRTRLMKCSNENVDMVTDMNLLSIMRLHPVRDEVMYWLSPLDALNLRLTCKDMIPSEDMGKYTSIFKYIIPNRRWLMNKLKEGYCFTAMGSSLTTIMRYNVGSDRGYGALKNVSSKSWLFKLMYITLIVTKDERFVPCTDDFMPSYVLIRSNSDENKAADVTTNKTEYESRYVESDWNGIKIRITFPVVDQSTSEVLFIDDALYKMVPEAAYEKSRRECNTIRYCNMTENSCVISEPIKPVVGNGIVFAQHVRMMFQIMVSLPNSKRGTKKVVYIVT